MSDLVQWPRAKYWDKAWNPAIGCRPCSPACDNCYAAALAKRFGMSFVPHEGKDYNPPRSGVVFCGNMTDLFGGWVDDGEEYVRRSLGCSDKATYLWLTKRPGAMFEALSKGLAVPADDPDDMLPFSDFEFCNQFFGFTAEDQELYHNRSYALSQKPDWANAWLSAEPLLGPIDLGLKYVSQHPLRWVVVGCESGPNRRPCKAEWVYDIVAQCRASDVPVFVKQLDIDGKCVTDISRFPEDLRIRQVPWVGCE